MNDKPAKIEMVTLKLLCAELKIDPREAREGVAVSDPSDVAAGVKKAMDGAKTDKDKDTVKVLMQVKSGDQTRFVALSLKKA
jgi:hypothetical protein